jgi:hypothetical protein
VVGFLFTKFYQSLLIIVNKGKIMEKFKPQEYRDDLSEQLKELRSKGAEGKEDAKLVLDAEQGTKEYKDSEEFHHKEIQRFLGEKAERERVELHEAKVAEMKKIVEGLPFDYIPVPVSPNNSADAVLLKIQGTEVAFLVGNDLKYCGSSYGIKAGGEKMFILCGCHNCGNYNDNFLESLKDTATKEKIKTIISRYTTLNYKIPQSHFSTGTLNILQSTEV